MEKRGVVDGISKTASDDNKSDAVGDAVKCINGASRDLLSAVSQIKSIKEEINKLKKDINKV